MDSKTAVGFTIAMLVAACGQPSPDSVGMASGPGGRATSTSGPDTPAGDSSLPKASVDPVALQQALTSHDAAAQPQDPLLPYAGEWDPESRVPHDTASIVMYVTARVAFVCPTRRQAQDRSCPPPHRASRGKKLAVIPDSLFDGHYRVIIESDHEWYPRWVRADDVALAPAPYFLDQFAGRSDVQAAQPATPKLSKREIATWPAGTSVAWQARSDIKFGMSHGQTDIVYFVPVVGGIVGVRFREGSAGNTSQRHSCWMYVGKCIELDAYQCEPNDSCAAVSILATTTGTMIEVPKKFDGWGEYHSEPWPWPKKWRGKIPLLEGVVMADRMDLMEYPLLDQWAGDGTPERAIYDLYDKLNLLAAKEPRLHDMASKKIATNLGLFFETGTHTEPDPDYATRKAAFDAELRASPRSTSWIASHRPEEQRVVFADDGIVLSMIVRDERDGPIQTVVPADRIMGPYHFLEVRVEGPNTAAFKKLRSEILALVDGEIRGFGK